MALHRIRAHGELEVASLLTTVTDSFHRVSMHGVREELLDAQARALGYPLEKVRIPYPCPNEIYEQKMRASLLRWKTRNVTHAVFGDLFLEDIRRYREEKLSELGLKPVFPLWLEDTAKLAIATIQEGFRAHVVCVDLKKLDSAFAGREFDEAFLSDLPPHIDPCGENGEFHTFVFEGPIFRDPIPVIVGGSTVRDGFQFVDLLPERPLA